MTLDEKKAEAAAWFRELRDRLCTEFERIETELTDSPAPIGTFTRTPWQRPEGGSGEISMMKGRVFEKVGVNISVVHGIFSEPFRKEIPGAEQDPNFWAAGISLVAHMQSPLVPAAHTNTRMIAVGDGPARLWFGGGGDLNPMVENAADTQDFHAAFRQVCDEAEASWARTAMSPQSDVFLPGQARQTSQTTMLNHPARTGDYGSNTEPSPTHPESLYETFRAWCDEYFYLPHRNESRGVGGIFYDYLGLNSLGADTSPVTSGKFGKGGVTAAATAAGMQRAANTSLSWNQGFEFTQNVGRAFLEIYPQLIRRHMFERWTEAQRHHQLVKRGRYAEYNLLYDRGTRFGLMTGGNVEAILMSLPPLAIWE